MGCYFFLKKNDWLFRLRTFHIMLSCYYNISVVVASGLLPVSVDTGNLHGISNCITSFNLRSRLSSITLSISLDIASCSFLIMIALLCMSLHYNNYATKRRHFKPHDNKRTITSKKLGMVISNRKKKAWIYRSLNCIQWFQH